ncbi:MAG: adenylate kinase [Anaerolineales bacterium]|nr:adenylate kinase [Anaerolineales bacterium]
MRIHIVGASGAGKSTLARRLSSHFRCRHVELDAYRWRPLWQKTPDHHLQAVVRQLLRGDAWVIDGSYASVRAQIWGRADTLIWLDYPAPLVVCRLLHRGVRDIVQQTDLWGTGNREGWRWLLGKESLVLRSLRTWRDLRATLPALCAEGRHRHLRLVHLHSPRETDAWLAAVARAAYPVECAMQPIALSAALWGNGSG